MTAKATAANAELVTRSESKAAFHLDMVSVFPQDTWHGRKNGLRAELMARLEAVRSAFVRFPGGCFC